MSVGLKAVIFLFILVSVNCRWMRPALREIIHVLEKDNIIMPDCNVTLLPQVDFDIKNNKIKEVFCKAHKALKNINCKNINMNIKKLQEQLQAIAGQKRNCILDETSLFEPNEFMKGLRSYTRHAYKESKP